jgi:hypothetical protein
MKSIKTVLPILLLLFGSLSVNAQKTMSEGSFSYNLRIHKAGADTSAISVTNYIKGSLSRTDMFSISGTESTIHNIKTGDAVILKEYSGQKLMITLTKENWDDRNKKMDSLAFSYDTMRVKKIDGYNCRHATAQLGNGTTIDVYYTIDISILNKEYDHMFKNLEGFPVKYSIGNSKFDYSYELSKIDFTPVTSAKFDYPRSGYRVMTYEESAQYKK